MRLDTILIDMEENIQNANKVKELVLANLIELKTITKEQATNFDNNYQVTIYKNTWFNKLISKDKAAFFYKMIKLTKS